ncbi:signal transduction histidine kinase [Saccharothrix ecbatanensis]|uniref:Signal transduction histidine-protein kinase/phosphatase MprB n=1 Tax=Saccharothrix ecbatanensis TaxID=1105145 RepID=A0A7W9HIK2_9PSEU|nr:HAMP domain-containing sensor histidine kinase [Saccharothrix ecbatanensis]MBB5802982.1 signal transduction histidine kinase [Saccharothrix ecbatanensis]
MRRALVLVALACASAILVAVLVPLAVVTREVARRAALADAERSVTAVVGVIATADGRSAIARGLAEVVAVSGHAVSVYTPDGPVGAPRARGPQVDAARNGPLVEPVANGVVLLRPVRLGEETFVAEVFLAEEQLERGVGRVWAMLAAVVIAMVTGAVLLVDRLALGLVGSVRRLAMAAHRFGRGDLVERIDPTGPPELVDVALTFNLMAERITALLAVERSRAADLSHRLRTPLTALRIDVENLRGPGVDRVLRAARHLDEELDRMIRDASRPAATTAAGTSCDLAAVVAERTGFWSPLADDERRRHSVRCPDAPAPVPVAREDIAAVVDILIGNVFRHTQPGTEFRVTVHADGHRVTLAVDDAGPGFPDPSNAPRPSSGSTGLGLDIARRVVEATGGVVRLRRSPLGGAQVVLAFARAS